ncbi:MAG TPA: endonuclease/exonuclease/phosphatase family protein, partial [Phycisphaerales bacterium]|nr:endonuclease/exonuclease/phosphatase family protein [Phycisphaerales bacterium]
LGEEYVHQAPAAREHLYGEAIFSKLPFTREPRVIMPEDGRDLPQVMAWVEWQGRELCVWDIHLHSPISLGSMAGQASLAWEMGAELDALAAAGTPAIVAGDFNSPWGGQPLDAVRERRYREAHREVGSGIGRSWPAQGILLRLPPGIRIDHITYSRELECVEAWGGEWTSSDHRPQFARFMWGD